MINTSVLPNVNNNSKKSEANKRILLKYDLKDLSSVLPGQRIKGTSAPLMIIDPHAAYEQKTVISFSDLNIYIVSTSQKVATIYCSIITENSMKGYVNEDTTTKQILCTGLSSIITAIIKAVNISKAI